jgi:HTH-type transcriptional regulator/antitoxin HipB
MNTWRRTPQRLLRGARITAGLTQGQLARRAGVTQQMISKLEDPGSNLTLRSIVRVFAVLGLEVSINVKRKVRRGQ